MKLMTPTVTVQNTDQREWLIKVENLVSTTEFETVTFTAAVPRSADSLQELTNQAVRRTIELLQTYLDMQKQG